jgi:hypothetical protein
MKPATVAAVLAIAWATTVLIDATAQEPAGTPVSPCVVITGADSHVAQRRYQRITSADKWTRVWQEHKGQKPTGQYDLFYDPLTLPQVDFDRYMVIAVFQGSGWNNAGLRAFSLADEDTRILLRFANKSYQTGGADGGGKKVTAYGFFVVPRSAKPVVLEENAQQYKRGKPPVWEERITFPKL